MSDSENSKDFTLYQSGDEKVLQTFSDFASDFANCVVSQEWHEAFQYLAPWLQKKMSPDDLRLAIEERLFEINHYWNIENLIYPSSYSVDYNPCSLAQLKEPMSWRKPRQFDNELTEENFRKWMVIQFLPDENDPRTEMDAWFDFWLVIADVKPENRFF
jgi:hypothetical protein